MVLEAVALEILYAQAFFVEGVGEWHAIERQAAVALPVVAERWADRVPGFFEGQALLARLLRSREAHPVYAALAQQLVAQPAELHGVIRVFVLREVFEAVTLEILGAARAPTAELRLDDDRGDRV